MNNITPNNLDQSVFTEQIKILYQTTTTVLLVNIVIAPAFVFGFWGAASHTILIIWLGLILILAAARIIMFNSYKKHFNADNAHQYARLFVISSFLSGLIWGIGGAMMFPDQLFEYQLFILFTLSALGAGTVITYGIYLPAFNAYFVTSIFPLGIKLIAANDSLHVSLGFMTLGYIVILSFLSLNMNTRLKQALSLQFENIQLIDQLREQKEEAENANIAKTKFLAAASHDLRQPLHALSLFTSVLDESPLQEKERTIVEKIKSTVDALKSLFNALLDISRLDAGTMKIEKNAFKLQPLLDKLLNDFEPLAKEKNLGISFDHCEYIVCSDKTLIEQVLRNYISNAINYTEKGEVRISCQRDNQQLKINVTDSGTGIPEHEQQSIFKEFYQLNNPERDRNKGLGLGLAIVRRTAQLLKHPIEVMSTYGKGSQFSITLDLADHADEPVLDNNDFDVYAKRTDKHNVLVIDDDPSVQEATQILLEMWGYNVITAADKNEALHKLAQHNIIPQAIIADYRLRHQQTGIQVVQLLQNEFNREIPAIIVTGDTASDRIRELTSSGFQVLHKPVAPAKLRAFLRNSITSIPVTN